MVPCQPTVSEFACVTVGLLGGYEVGLETASSFAHLIQEAGPIVETLSTVAYAGFAVPLLGIIAGKIVYELAPCLFDGAQAVMDSVAKNQKNKKAPLLEKIDATHVGEDSKLQAIHQQLEYSLGTKDYLELLKEKEFHIPHFEEKVKLCLDGSLVPYFHALDPSGEEILIGLTSVFDGTHYDSSTCDLKSSAPSKEFYNLGSIVEELMSKRLND